jgi:ADP-ribose pyrophosphatase
MMPTMLRTKTLASRRQFAGKILSLRVDTIQIADHSPVEREIVEHPGSVVIVPVTDRSTVLMVRQWRHPTNEELLEAPAGHIDPGETPEAAAQRELQEETGHIAARLIKLSEFWIAPGWCTEYMHAYLALGLSASRLDQDVDEDVRVEEVPLAQIPALISSGAIKDAKSIGTLLLASCLWKDRLPAGRGASS